MYTIRCLLLLLLLHSAGMATAQVVSTMPAGAAGECYFLYEVKLIDEFIERFNDEPQSYIRQQCKAKYGTDSMMTRITLLKTLLNKKQSWSGQPEEFIKWVTDAARPQYLSFTDSDWYAEAKCTFTYNGKKIELPLLLHIKAAGGGYKWMISGVGNSTIFGGKPAPAAKVDGTTTAAFIPTSAHGTDFVVFNNVFSGAMHPADFFEPALLATSRGQYFVSLIKQRKITFQYAKGIKYHFFGIDNWVFTVEQYKRKETNTGWLISSLQKVSPGEKAGLLRKLLYP